MLPAVPRWQNWAGNQAAAPHRVITPRSAAEVAEAVALATRDGLPVRMTGSGHSFSMTERYRLDAFYLCPA